MGRAARARAANPRPTYPRARRSRSRTHRCGTDCRRLSRSTGSHSSRFRSTPPGGRSPWNGRPCSASWTGWCRPWARWGVCCARAGSPTRTCTRSARRRFRVPGPGSCVAYAGPVGSTARPTCGQRGGAVPARARRRAACATTPRINPSSAVQPLDTWQAHYRKMFDVDLLVLGSGPGGQKAAIAAAKLGRRVAIVERRGMIGGVCINTGTVPSKTLREAVLYLTGLNQRELYGQSYRLKDDITVADLAARTQHVIGREVDVIRNQLSRNRIRLLTGTARFRDPQTIGITDDAGRESTVTAEKIVIAAGTRPARPSTVDFDGTTIVDSDGIISLERVPQSMVVVGAGVIGIEYASMFAALGTKVTVVERRDRMLEFCDLEVVEALKYHLRELDVTFRFRDYVSSDETAPLVERTEVR